MEGKIRIAGTVGESIVDGPGFRYTLFVQGCPHGCPGCHNPQTHDFEGGQDIELDTLLKDMCRNPFIKGVTFSGGEPFCKAEPLYYLAVELKRKGKHLMAYSGYTFEQLLELSDPFVKKLLGQLDLLVDGPFLMEEKNIELTFPEDYHAKELAGAPVVFKVKVKEVKETVVPEKDDEFVKDVSEFDTVAELRADIEKRIREEKQNGIDRAFENAAIEKAVENMTVEIPDSMVEEELDQELERMDYELRSQGASLQAYAQMIGGSMDTMRNSLRPSALHAVKTNVMLDAVVDAEKLEVTDEECEEEYKRLADSYKLEVEKVKEILDEKGMRGDLQVKKAAKLIADSAVAVPVKKDEETKAE